MKSRLDDRRMWSRDTPSQRLYRWVASTRGAIGIEEAIEHAPAGFWDDDELRAGLRDRIDELREAETATRRLRLRLEALHRGQEHHCQHCGTAMFARARARYCSAACRVAASRARATAEAVQVTTNATPELDRPRTLQPGQVMGLDGKVYPGRSADTTPRDEYIRYRRDQGATIRVIAGEAGCSVGTVQRVIKR